MVASMSCVSEMRALHRKFSFQLDWPLPSQFLTRTQPPFPEIGEGGWGMGMKRKDWVELIGYEEIKISIRIRFIFKSEMPPFFFIIDEALFFHDLF